LPEIKVPVLNIYNDWIQSVNFSSVGANLFLTLILINLIIQFNYGDILEWLGISSDFELMKYGSENKRDGERSDSISYMSNQAISS